MAVIVVNWVKLSGSFSSTHSHSYCRKKGQRCSAVLHRTPGGSVVQALFWPVVLCCRWSWEYTAAPCDLTSVKLANIAENLTL